MNAPPTEGEIQRATNGEDYVFRNGKWEHVPWVPTLSHMPMRDWFAGQALAGLVAYQYGAELHRIFDKNNAVADAGPTNECPQDYAARIAYSLADAMLKARAVKPEGKP